jgi:hypothetical protein
MKNTPKIQGKISETLWNMRKPIKIFGSHDNIIWSIYKLDYAYRKVRTEAGKFLQSL